MIWLILGVLIWAGVHLVPAMAPDARAKMIARMGAGAWKGAFAAAILVSILLMVVGWRGAGGAPWHLWPLWVNHIVVLLMLPAFILFISARAPNNIRRHIRHPQLTGVKLWAVLHLLVNIDARSLVLFGGMLAWAVVQVIFINKREGAWVKPDPVPMPKALIGPLAGVILWVAFFALHPWLFGVSPLG